MSDLISKQCSALLKEAAEMFQETGCVPGFDGEDVPAETIVPDAKEYIVETIDDPDATFRPDDMGYTWICLGRFVAGTKMETKMSEASASEKQGTDARSDHGATKVMSRFGCD